MDSCFFALSSIGKYAAKIKAEQNKKIAENLCSNLYDNLFISLDSELNQHVSVMNHITEEMNSGLNREEIAALFTESMNIDSYLYTSILAIDEQTADTIYETYCHVDDINGKPGAVIFSINLESLVEDLYTSNFDNASDILIIDAESKTLIAEKNRALSMGTIEDLLPESADILNELLASDEDYLIRKIDNSNYIYCKCQIDGTSLVAVGYTKGK